MNGDMNGERPEEPDRTGQTGQFEQLGTPGHRRGLWDRFKVRRPRNSTVALTALFLAVFALWILVRPIDPGPQPSGAANSGTSGSQGQSEYHPYVPPSPTPSLTPTRSPSPRPTTRTPSVSPTATPHSSLTPSPGQSPTGTPSATAPSAPGTGGSPGAPTSGSTGAGTGAGGAAAATPTIPTPLSAAGRRRLPAVGGYLPAARRRASRRG